MGGSGGLGLRLAAALQRREKHADLRLERAVPSELAWLPATGLVVSGGTECHTAPHLLPTGLRPCQPRGRLGSQLSAGSQPFKSLAWLLAWFGPGHACKGSRSELLQQKRARTIAWLARGERWVTDAGRNPKALGPVARYDSCPTVAYGISRRPVSKRFCSTSASNGEPTNRTKSPSITA